MLLRPPYSCTVMLCSETCNIKCDKEKKCYIPIDKNFHLQNIRILKTV